MKRQPYTPPRSKKYRKEWLDRIEKRGGFRPKAVRRFYQSMSATLGAWLAGDRDLMMRAANSLSDEERAEVAAWFKAEYDQSKNG